MIGDPEIGNADVMDLRDLRSFAAVARTGSFTQAATDLGYTQSAVSQHVAALEQSVGQSLLHRRPVRLTPAGRRLLEHADHILLRLDVARSELTRVEQQPTRLVVACTPLAPIARLASALRSTRIATPRLQIAVSSVDGAGAVSAVASGRADVALIDGVVAPGNPLALTDAGLLASFSLDEEPVAVALPTDHPLRGASVDLAALVDAQWIDAPSLSAPRADLPGWQGGPAGEPTITYDGTDLATMLALIANGHGLAVLPGRVVDGCPGVRALPLRFPSLVHRSEILVLKNAVDRHRRLIDALRAG
ncbi:MAG: LysR family transcriptional regulator [Ilumatobacteraceae bacterium]|nr:LysR family transcriptional regulator [Ilumatobacteraceae bacterium]